MVTPLPPTNSPKRKISNAAGNEIPLLYHYQPYRAERLIDFLRTKRAWCSVIANVNDPWDCTMAFKIDDDDTASRTIAHLKSIARPSKHGPEADAAMDFELKNNPAMLRDVTRAIAEQAHKDANEMRRIYCLTPRIDSTLMWSHYAENHKGICLEFAVKGDNVFGSAFKVIYEEEFISQELFSDTDPALLPFFVKAKCWDYEHEYRLFLRVPEPAAMFRFPPAMHVIDNRFAVPEDALTAVVVGCCTPRAVGVRIQELVAEHWPSVRVKKMVKQHDRYELEVHDFNP